MTNFRKNLAVRCNDFFCGTVKATSYRKEKMKKYLTLILIICATSLFVQAQKESPDLLVTNSGDLFEGSQLEYHTPILQPSFFKLDEKRFETTEVYQFQNRHGFFTSLAPVHGERRERYAFRTRTGKIDCYEEVELELYGGEDLGVDFPEKYVDSMDPMLAKGNYVQYYIKGDQKIKKTTYRNLVHDVADNPVSSGHMKRFRNMRWLQYGLIAGGAALISGGLATQNPEYMKMTPTVAFGIVLGGGSYLLERPKENAIWAAIETYNQ
jgi:hypothetical protein